MKISWIKSVWQIGYLLNPYFGDSFFSWISLFLYGSAEMNSLCFISGQKDLERKSVCKRGRSRRRIYGRFKRRDIELNHKTRLSIRLTQIRDFCQYQTLLIISRIQGYSLDEVERSMKHPKWFPGSFFLTLDMNLWPTIINDSLSEVCGLIHIAQNV